MTYPYTESAERFAQDTKQHQLEIRHDDGLYRHLRFKIPRSSLYWFDLVTWPGCLSFTGDFNGFTFMRLQDMFEFFRADYGVINPGYWSEKVVSGHNEIQTYSPGMLKKLVTEHFVEDVRDGTAPRGLGKAIHRDILDDSDLCDLEGAYDLLRNFEYKGYRFEDSWEWNLREFDWQFLWCCHAIRWGISQYDIIKRREIRAHEHVG